MQLHYFCAGSHWWVIEADPAEGAAFGYVCLNGDTESAEWGYIDLTELAALYLAPWFIVERDLRWTPCPAKPGNTVSGPRCVPCPTCRRTVESVMRALASQHFCD